MHICSEKSLINHITINIVINVAIKYYNKIICQEIAQYFNVEN